MQSNNWDLPKSTARPSKGSKSISKGNLLEKNWSGLIHKKEAAVLISPVVLRDLGCGQVDICSIKNKTLTLYEVKARPEGINFKQRSRLLNSLELLTNIFQLEGQIRLIGTK